MIRLVLALGLLGISAASPIICRDTSDYPKQSTSKGFSLVVNVTDSSMDFDPPVHGNFVASIHTGAGIADVGTSPEKGRVFYQNGTAAEKTDGLSTVITDGGTPPFPSGIKLTPDLEAGYSVASLDAGPGTPGVQLLETPYAYLTPERFLACNESLPYYQGKYFITIRQTSDPSKVPANCRQVNLIPECAELDSLPEGAYSSHEFAQDVQCYDNVSSIVWKNYTPWI